LAPIITFHDSGSMILVLMAREGIPWLLLLRSMILVLMARESASV
jgi:hypothetical protein